VLGRPGPVPELAGRLDDDVDSELLPREPLGVLLGVDLEPVPVNHDRVVVDRDLAVEDAVHGVVLEEVREGLRVGEVVHGDEIEVLVAGDRPENQSTDPPETVDRELEGHGVLLAPAARAYELDLVQNDVLH